MFSANGHLDQKYKKSRSTSNIKTTPNFVDNKHNSSDLILLQTKTNVVFATITDVDNYLPIRQISTDQMGKFPILSNRGNRYIMVVYEYDINAIYVEPMINKSTVELIRKYNALHNRLCGAGIKLLYQKLDNELPAAF